MSEEEINRIWRERWDSLTLDYVYIYGEYRRMAALLRFERDRSEQHRQNCEAAYLSGQEVARTYIRDIERGFPL